MALISPLGGFLVDRRLRGEGAEEACHAASAAPRLTASDNVVADLELLADGAYSPMSGFMPERDYRSVVEHAVLSDGSPWTLPVVLPITADDEARLEGAKTAAIVDVSGTIRGTVEVAEVYERDLDVEAREVYRTTDDAHPGVRAMRDQGRLAVAGEVTVFEGPREASALTPRETRREFERREWSTVVAFQTRNPIHRAHEYLTKVALEQVDGLLIHPLVGLTKEDDVPADVRMECYRVLLRDYYPPERVLLSTFAAAMRYAGPREAVYHGLVRRNYGCSHFIIGRDAAGVGSYYGTYDAQHLYDELGGAEKLGFEALKFEHSFYCKRCDSMASTRTCPHSAEDRLILSGTKVRAMLDAGEAIPAQFSRPEVAEVLRNAYSGKEMSA